MHESLSGLLNTLSPCAGVAFLESKFDLDLQHAMLLVPTFYCLSGIAFYGAEAVIKKEKQKALE